MAYAVIRLPMACVRRFSSNTSPNKLETSAECRNVCVSVCVCMYVCVCASGCEKSRRRFEPAYRWRSLNVSLLWLWEVGKTGWLTLSLCLPLFVIHATQFACHHHTTPEKLVTFGKTPPEVITDNGARAHYWCCCYCCRDKLPARYYPCCTTTRPGGIFRTTPIKPFAAHSSQFNNVPLNLSEPAFLLLSELMESFISHHGTPPRSGDMRTRCHYFY